MNKVFKWSGGVLLCASMPLMAEEPPKLPNANVDVNVSIASNYVFRGQDMYANRFVQKRQAFDSINQSPSLQPSITFKTPVDGLTFNILGAFALAGRGDKDIDQRIQNARPAGNNADATSANSIVAQTLVDMHTGTAGSFHSILDGKLQTLQGGTKWPTTSIAATNAPNLYKDPNGLERADEIDLTLGYSSSTRVGVIGFGVVTYNYVNPKAKGNPFAQNPGGGAGSPYYFGTEMFVTYALPMFPDLTAKAYHDIVNSNQYYQLVYSKTIAINDKVSVGVTTGPSYSIVSNQYSLTGAGALNQTNVVQDTQQTVQGWKDWTSNVSVILGGLTVGLNAAYRPDLRFYDSDLATNRVVALDGQSTMDDGLVNDPSKVGNGLASDLVQLFVNSNQRVLALNPRYAWTPRQKLPKWIYWANVGYTATF
ncbi:MAG: hypothetical protein JNM27_00595 [Leptospirales bacterium]|nr:hypothetical protein [Leptospirales bacterium]